jgi:FKBP-type peptidyl-prolyl cis-trans isomerase (trigger factor)
MAFFRKREAPAPQTPGVSVTDTAPCQKALRLIVSPQELTPVRAAVLSEFRKTATVPGFRPGRAPAELIERQYGPQVQDETLKRAMRQALEQAAQHHRLKPVGPFEITSSTVTDAEGLVFEATVEVEPAFALSDYKGIPLVRLSAEVTPEEVQQALAKLQESMAQLVPAERGGKERRLPPLDAELAKDLGFERLEALTAHVEATLRDSKRRAQAQAMEAALCEELLRRQPFEVPPRLVQRQTDRLTREGTARLLLSGLTQDEAVEETAKFTEQLARSAERLVKLDFMLDRIAEQETITVSPDEVLARLWELGRRWQMDPAAVRRVLDDKGLWPAVVSAIRRDKTVAWLLAAAVVQDQQAGVT